MPKTSYPAPSPAEGALAAVPKAVAAADAEYEESESEEDDEATFEKVLRECPDLDVNFVEDPRCPQAKSVACGRSPLWWAVKNNNIRMVR